MGDFKEHYKQEAIDFLYASIVQMIKNGGEDGIFVDEILHGIDLRDVRAFMQSLITNQNLPFRLPTIKDPVINDSETLAMLGDYIQANAIRFPSSSEQRIYFIETDDFAITVIPIELDNGNLAINIEPLDHSPQFVRDIYEESEKLQMKNITLIRYDNDGNRIE